MHNLVFQLPCLNIGHIINITYPINLKHGCRHEMDLASGHIIYFIWELIQWMVVGWNIYSKGIRGCIPYAHWCKTHMVLPNILKCFNPRTKKFEFGLHPRGIWYNSMGDEVGWVCSLCNLPKEVTRDLLIKNTNNSQCLKDEMTFAFLTKVSSHM